MLKNVPAEEKFTLPMRIYSFGLMIGEETITTAAENIFFQYRSHTIPILSRFRLRMRSGFYETDLIINTIRILVKHQGKCQPEVSE